jgi:hypothetical protein
MKITYFLQITSMASNLVSFHRLHWEMQEYSTCLLQLSFYLASVLDLCQKAYHLILLLRLISQAARILLIHLSHHYFLNSLKYLIFSIYYYHLYSFFLYYSKLWILFFILKMFYHYHLCLMCLFFKSARTN